MGHSSAALAAAKEAKAAHEAEMEVYEAKREEWVAQKDEQARAAWFAYRLLMAEAARIREQLKKPQKKEELPTVARGAKGVR